MTQEQVDKLKEIQEKLDYLREVFLAESSRLYEELEDMEIICDHMHPDGSTQVPVEEGILVWCEYCGERLQ